MKGYKHVRKMVHKTLLTTMATLPLLGDIANGSVLRGNEGLSHQQL